jgi:hypothetical protein
MEAAHESLVVQHRYAAVRRHQLVVPGRHLPVRLLEKPGWWKAVKEKRTPIDQSVRTVSRQGQ